MNFLKIMETTNIGKNYGSIIVTEIAKLNNEKLSLDMKINYAQDLRFITVKEVMEYIDSNKINLEMLSRTEMLEIYNGRRNNKLQFSNFNLPFYD